MINYVADTQTILMDQLYIHMSSVYIFEEANEPIHQSKSLQNFQTSRYTEFPGTTVPDSYWLNI